MPDYPSSTDFRSRMAALFGARQQNPYMGNFATYGQSGGEHQFFGGPPPPPPSSGGSPGGPGGPGGGGDGGGLAGIPTNQLVAMVRQQNTANDRFPTNTGGRPLDIAGGPGTLGDRGGGNRPMTGGQFDDLALGLSPGRQPILGLAGWLPGPVGWGARTANAALGVTAERQKQDAVSQFTGKPAGSWGQSLWAGATGLGSTYDMGGYGVPGQGGLTGLINTLDPGVANKPGASPRTLANLAARNYAATGKVTPARPERETRNDRVERTSLGREAVASGRMEDRTGRSIGGGV